LWQAPRDAVQPVAHVLVNTLCTPGPRFVLAYLRAVLLPDPEHMGKWYGRRHWGWRTWAHVLRWLWPMVKHVRPLWSWSANVETRVSDTHGISVFATRDLEAGQVIARCRRKCVKQDGHRVMESQDRSGHTQRYEMTGTLKFLNHSCRPNAELSGSRLIARKRIAAGQKITIDDGEEACTCRQQQDPSSTDQPPNRAA